MEIVVRLWSAFAPQILTLVGLILLQVALAVALALKLGKFELKKLADFYRSMVLPYLIGWIGFVAAGRLLAAELLGPEYSLLASDSVTWLAWLAIVISLGGRIYETARELYGALSPVKLPNGPQ